MVEPVQIVLLIMLLCTAALPLPVMRTRLNSAREALCKPVQASSAPLAITAFWPQAEQPQPPQAFVPHLVAGAAGWPVRVFGTPTQLGIALLCQARRPHQHSSSHLQHTVLCALRVFLSTRRQPARTTTTGRQYPKAWASSFSLSSQLCGVPQCLVNILYLPICDPASRPCRLHVACSSQQNQPSCPPYPLDASPLPEPQRLVRSGFASQGMLTGDFYGNRISITDARSHHGHVLAAGASV